MPCAHRLYSGGLLLKAIGSGDQQIALRKAYVHSRLDFARLLFERILLLPTLITQLFLVL